MTAQVSDLIVLSERELPLLCNPLDDYFAVAKKPSPFRGSSTACWRGYIARWLIEDGRLFITSVTNRLPPLITADGDEITLATLFPDAPPPIEARWFTGTLRIGHDGLLKYVHMGYASVYANEEYIDVAEGRVTSSTKVHGFSVLHSAAAVSVRGATQALRRNTRAVAVIVALAVVAVIVGLPRLIVGALLFTAIGFAGLATVERSSRSDWLRDAEWYQGQMRAVLRGETSQDVDPPMERSPWFVEAAWSMGTGAIFLGAAYFAYSESQCTSSVFLINLLYFIVFITGAIGLGTMILSLQDVLYSMSKRDTPSRTKPPA